MSNEITLHLSIKYPQEACASRQLAHLFVQEAPELAWQNSAEEAVDRIMQSIESEERWELKLMQGDTVVGVAVCLPDADDHVGVCLSVQWRFVRPDLRGSAGVKLQRGILQLARENGFRVLAYTRRVGPAKYELKYVRLR